MSDNYEKVIEKENMIELLESSIDSSVLEVGTKGHAASSTSNKMMVMKWLEKVFLATQNKLMTRTKQRMCVLALLPHLSALRSLH